MTHFKVGDKVIITEGDFKGEHGAITDKHLIGDGLTVALEKHGREIKTHEAHVNKVDDGASLRSGQCSSGQRSRCATS